MRVYLCVVMCMSAGTQGGQRHGISQEMGLQVTVNHLTWTLGPGRWSSQGAVHILSHGAISPASPGISDMI